MMESRLHILFAVLVLFPVATPGGQEQGGGVLEQSVCGLQEPFMFWLWSGMAGNPDTSRLDGLPHVEPITFQTRDDRTLGGYRLRATGREGRSVPPRGYLLIIQGNAMLADQIIGSFVPFSSAGLDVYVYDFRGYGRSGGKRRLKAIVSDYREILAALGSSYGQRLVYAMSIGGVILLDGLDPGALPDRIVIDSAPSRLSGYGCPPAYDPVDHLPGDCSHFLFIAGDKDHVVSPAMSRELVETAQQRGAQVVRDATFGHPFMDYDRSVHRRRLQLIQDYLLAEPVDKGPWRQ